MDHALDLADEILTGGWDWTQTLEVRARLGGMSNETIVFDTIDGFHRQAGIKARIPDWREREYSVPCVVLYNCSDQELFEKRILAANSVKSVKFSRIGLWMNLFWQHTSWKDKITLTQAFGIANYTGPHKLNSHLRLCITLNYGTKYTTGSPAGI